MRRNEQSGIIVSCFPLLILFFLAMPPFTISFVAASTFMAVRVALGTARKTIVTGASPVKLVGLPPKGYALAAGASM